MPMLPEHEIHDKKCFDRHTGFWMIALEYFLPLAQSILSGKTLPLAKKAESIDEPSYVVDKNGIARLQMYGPMMKGYSKYADNVSTLALRRSVRELWSDDFAKGVLIDVESPGGTVAGTFETADDITRLARIKPVYVQVSDFAASAAVWAISGATRIYVNEAGQMGSVGAMAIVEDTFGAKMMEGVKVFAVTSGSQKADFIAGTEITPEMLSRLQERIDHFGNMFASHLQKNRHLSSAAMKTITTAEIFTAHRAVELGLADGVVDIETTYKNLNQEIKDRAKVEREATTQKMRNAMI